MKKVSRLVLGLLVLAGFLSAGVVNASCYDVTFSQLQNAADSVTKGFVSGGSGGFGLDMWVTMVDETGSICHVLTTGESGKLAGNSEWLGSRVISAQKANTANAFSLNAVSISTGALYAAVQPGGSLFGLQESNPINAAIAYSGSPYAYGKRNDPLVGKRLGGINVFGGGIALYKNSIKIGAIGVSGDTSCTDHAFAWKVRNALALDSTSPGGFELLNLATTFSALGDHPNCFQDSGLNNQAAFGFN